MRSMRRNGWTPAVSGTRVAATVHGTRRSSKVGLSVKNSPNGSEDQTTSRSSEPLPFDLRTPQKLLDHAGLPLLPESGTLSAA